MWTRAGLEQPWSPVRGKGKKYRLWRNAVGVQMHETLHPGIECPQGRVLGDIASVACFGTTGKRGVSAEARDHTAA